MKLKKAVLEWNELHPDAAPQVISIHNKYVYKYMFIFGPPCGPLLPLFPQSSASRTLPRCRSMAAMTQSAGGVAKRRGSGAHDLCRGAKEKTLLFCLIMAILTGKMVMKSWGRL